MGGKSPTKLVSGFQNLEDPWTTYQRNLKASELSKITKEKYSWCFMCKVKAWGCKLY